jgi:hypothetical protein
MRVLSQLAIIQDSSPNFPFGAIKNETDTADGTPVIREVYNDLLVNIYKLLQVSGINPTGDEDSDTSQYQIIDALKKLPNSLNDIEQVLNRTGTIWSIPFDLALLPNKYFLMARASEDYVDGTIYTFKGAGATELPFTSTGFNASDELLVIIDTAGVRAYSLSFLTATPTEVFTVMGLPLAYNNTAKMWYQEEGNLISDAPSIDYLESIIRLDVSNGTVILNDILAKDNLLLCFCLIPSTNTYFFREFNIANLTVSSPVNIDIPIASASDFSPYIYLDKDKLYLTNAANEGANGYDFRRFIYAPGSLTTVSSFTIDNTFVKTTNAVIKDGLLYTMINGQLNSFNLTSGAKVSLGNYNGANGNIFGFNGEVYFTSGDVAKKWF